MNFIGRYVVNKFNKNKQKISQHVFYNHITDAGKKLILNLLEQASTKKFHNMQGYKVLNLQPYTIQTVFDESKSNYYQPEGKGFETWFGNLTQRSTDKIVFDVKSSLFFSYEYDFRYPSGTNDNHNSDNKKRKYPIYPAICYGKLLDGGYYQDESYYSNITEYYDYYSDDNGGNSTLLNNNSYSVNDVDKILMQNNLTSFSWKSKDFIDGYYRGDFLSKGLHNIDLFLVKCTQSILLNSQLFNNKTQIPLWEGRVRVGEDTEKRKTTLKYDSGSNHYYCLVGRYRVVGNEQWVYFEKNDVSIEFNSDKNIYYLKLKDSKFNNSDYEIQLVYYMYYQDKQLDNGICGMYLNYLQNIDNQKKILYSLIDNYLEMEYFLMMVVKQMMNMLLFRGKVNLSKEIHIILVEQALLDHLKVKQHGQDIRGHFFMIINILITMLFLQISIWILFLIDIILFILMLQLLLIVLDFIQIITIKQC